MKPPILVFPVDEDGIPYESKEILNTRASEKLHRYLLELDTFPGKNPSSIVISEVRTSIRPGGLPGGETPGLRVITAEGDILFCSYSGGSGRGLGKCPDLEPVKLRQGWAVWSPKEKTDPQNQLRVRIFATEGEAKAACVLLGAN